MKKHCFLFALFIFLSSLYMQAEGTAGKWSERYNFTAITMDEGLPHNFVDDILKDSQGFLWIATRGEGIARYDGYEFTAFHMGNTRIKLRSNFINKLCEGRKAANKIQPFFLGQHQASIFRQLHRLYQQNGTCMVYNYLFFYTDRLSGH